MIGILEVGLLGPITLDVDGRAVPVPSQQQRAVLARLALSADRVVTTAELVDTLWADDAPANATGNLHSYLSRLRRLVGADRIVHQHGGYRLHIGDEQVDVGRVERLAAEARTVVESARRADLLAEALSAWRGEPLADVADTLVFAAERARLSTLRWRLQFELLELRVSIGDAAEVLPDLEAAVTANALDERVHLLLMRALHGLGRTTEALRVAQRFRDRLVEQAGLDPSPALPELEQRLLADDPSLRPLSGRDSTPRVTGATAVPTYVTALHGRRRELDHIESVLRSERLVSLTGPGGVGKTRLAGAIAEDHAAVSGTVHYLALASVSAGTATLVDVLAGALGLRVESPRDSLTAIQERLGTEAQLLVIDNCEHVIAGARDLVDGLLAVPSELTILTTSRRPLGLTAECVVRVGPLTEPSAEGDDDWAPALRLFVERARRVRPTWQPDPAELATARAIIARLGAIPLAIELAAGRLSSLSLDDLAARLDHALDLLADGRPTAAVRQSSLRNTLEWSYELLNDNEQRLLRQLSVFADGADLAAVELVGSGIGLPAGGANELAALVDSSLVDADLDADARYAMLEPVRAFAGWHLNRSVERHTAAELLARWARQTAATIDRDGRGPNERTADQRLRRELRNLRAAHRAALDSGDLDTAISISASVTRVGTFRDLSDIWTWALDLADHPDLTGHPRQAHALGAAAEAAWLNGDLDRAGRLAQHGLTIDDRCVACRHALASVQLFRGDPAGAHELWAGISEDDGSYLAQTGLAAVYADDVTTAETVLDRARAWAADHGAPTDVAVAHYATGELLAPAIHAVNHYEQAIALTRDVGSTFVEGIATVGLASVRAAAGRHDDALRLYERAVRYWLRTGNWTQQWTTLRNLATLLADLGDQPTADILVGAAARAPAAATDKPAQERRHSAADGIRKLSRAQVVAIALDAITRTSARRDARRGDAQ